VPVKPPYGLLAEFGEADALVAAAERVRSAGYTRTEAFAPYPLPEAAHALGYRRTGVPAVIFLGGLLGCVGGFGMEYWISVIDYPENVGGRPLNSWPVFVPVAFELTVLTAALVGLIGLLVLCGLPRFHHPLFGVERFGRAAIDRFFLCIETADPKYDPAGTRAFLDGLSPLAVEEVPG